MKTNRRKGSKRHAKQKQTKLKVATTHHHCITSITFLPKIRRANRYRDMLGPTDQAV